MFPLNIGLWIFVATGKDFKALFEWVIWMIIRKSSIRDIHLSNILEKPSIRSSRFSNTLDARIIGEDHSRVHPIIRIFELLQKGSTLCAEQLTRFVKTFHHTTVRRNFSHFYTTNHLTEHLCCYHTRHDQLTLHAVLFITVINWQCTSGWVNVKKNFKFEEDIWRHFTKFITSSNTLRLEPHHILQTQIHG